MKSEQWEHDAFDALLRDALDCDAAPSEGFTERVMERVRRTPQEKPRKNRQTVRILAAVAACAVIAVSIPLAMPRMGSAMDSAAPANTEGCADSAKVEDNVDDAPQEQLMMSDSPDEGVKSNEKLIDRAYSDEYTETLTLTGDDAQAALAALAELGIQPTAAENSGYTYDLTEQQARELSETVDALYGIEGALLLVLEVAE